MDADAAPPLTSLLRGVDLLRVLDDDVLARLADRVQVLDHEAGAVVLAEGEEGSGLHLLLEGTATVERDGVALGVLGPGDHVGELSLLDGQPWLGTVRAESDLRTGYLTSEDFLDILESSPVVALELLLALAGRFRAVEEQLVALERRLRDDAGV